MTREEWSSLARERGICIVHDWYFGSILTTDNGDELIIRNEEKEAETKEFMHQGDKLIFNPNSDNFHLVGKAYNHKEFSDDTVIITNNIVSIKYFGKFSFHNMFFVVTTQSGSEYYLHMLDHNDLYFSI